MTRKQTASAIRAGFTLVELIVVIAIIAVMVALGAGVYFRYSRDQQIKDTQARLQALQELLNQHVRKVVEDANSEPPSNAAYQLAGWPGGSNPKAPYSPRAKVIWIKARLSEAFPMTFAEITNPSLIPPGKRENKTYLNRWASLNQNNHNAGTESSECLAIALAKNRGGANVDVEKYMADRDNDGLKEFIDDWKQPLVFIRFPTDHPELQASVPPGTGRTAKLRDPLDPDGTLMNPTWLGTANGNIFQTMFHPVRDPNNPQRSYYTTPVILSAGPDRKLGLNTTTMQPTSAAASDNIYSFKLRVGGGTKQ